MPKVELLRSLGVKNDTYNRGDVLNVTELMQKSWLEMKFAKEANEDAEIKADLVGEVQEVAEDQKDQGEPKEEAANDQSDQEVADDQAKYDFENMSVEDMRKECKAVGLSGYSSATRDELIAMLSEVGE